MEDTKLVAEIKETLKELRSYWNALKLEKIRDLWDSEEQAPLYLPEESEQFLTSWEEIRAYWATTSDTIGALKMRIWDVNARLLTPNLATAWYRMHWNGQVQGYPKAMGGENRVTALLRRTPEGWRFCQYVEAPLAPMLYLRRLYELDVDDDFAGPEPAQS